MSPEHPRWETFLELLGGPGFCDFREHPTRKLIWQCDSSADRPFTRAALQQLGLDAEAIDASLAYYDEHGGHCDCEVYLNIGR